MKPLSERIKLIDEAIDFHNNGGELHRFAISQAEYNMLYKTNILGFVFAHEDSPMAKGLDSNAEFVGTKQEFEQRVKEREEMKTKNDWYEKGELPPVGEKLKGASRVSCRGVEDWFDFPRYRVVAHHSNGKTFFVEVLDDNGNYLCTEKFDLGSSQYRPLRTEEDELVEQAENCLRNANTQVLDKYTYGTLSKQLIKAGWRPTEKKDD